jgi:hypothetical protein
MLGWQTKGYANEEKGLEEYFSDRYNLITGRPSATTQSDLGMFDQLMLRFN